MTAEATDGGARAGATMVVCLRGRRDDPGIADVVYVGRPLYRGGWRLASHPLANPYRIGTDGTAGEVVARYRQWLLRQPGLDGHLAVLRGRRLGCFCPAGQPCHAQVIAELADAAI
jgi:hypothetical protein